ncbi:MAG: acyl-CoA thioesterase [Mariprofundaceae bacterium]
MPDSRPMRASRWRSRHRVTHADLNGWGVMHGGRLLTLADEAGFRAAFAHACRPCLTRAVHATAFHAPAREHTWLRIESVLAVTGRTSLWTWVEIEDEADGRRVMDGCFVFVALDARGRPAAVPPVHAENAAERALQARVARIRERAGT